MLGSCFVQKLDIYCILAYHVGVHAWTPAFFCLNVLSERLQPNR